MKIDCKSKPDNITNKVRIWVMYVQMTINVVEPSRTG